MALHLGSPLRLRGQLTRGAVPAQTVQETMSMSLTQQIRYGIKEIIRILIIVIMITVMMMMIIIIMISFIFSVAIQ